MSKGHGHLIDQVLGRYRVAAPGSLTLASQTKVRRLAIEHADEFLQRFPERRRDFMVWATCNMLVDIKNRRPTALDFLGLAWRARLPVRWRELRSNMQRMRSTQVRWRQLARAASTSG